MSVETLHSYLATVWVVWFFLLFGLVIVWAMRPSRRKHFETLGHIPFRDERPAARQ